MNTVEGLRDALRATGHPDVGPLPRGDFPAGCWSDEEPEEPGPFGLNEVDRRQAALGREAT